MRWFVPFWFLQFLGAFNDVLLKTVLSFAGARMLGGGCSASGFVSVVGLLFILPFFLFSPISGAIADKFYKRDVIIGVKIAEVMIVSLIWLGFYFNSIAVLLLGLFLLVTQSVFFSPAKYGYLPEMTENLALVNGLLQSGTFIAVILGTILGGILLDLDGGYELVKWVLLGSSLLGLSLSLLVPNSGKRNAAVSIDYHAILKNLRVGFDVVFSDYGLRWAMFGLALFWAVASFYQMNLIPYGIYSRGWSNSQISLLFLMTALGIGIGSLISGLSSGYKIELGLVPLGGLLISLGFSGIGLSRGYCSVCLWSVFLGIGAGLYTVPISAYFQKQIPVSVRGRGLAVLNMATAFAGIVSAGMLFVLGKLLGIDSAILFFALGIFWFVIVLGIFRLLPYAFLRMVSWVIMHSIYRLEVYGLENIPKEGGGLLLCNHVSYIDGIIILSAVGRRVRFVFGEEVCKNWFIDLARRLSGSLVMRRSSPKAIAESLNAIVESINNGELVCLFPEGRLTVTGNIMEFRRGIEYLRKRGVSQFIPMYIDLMWGSVFTFAKGRLGIRLPRRFPYRVVLSIGQERDLFSAYEARRAVEETGTEAFSRRGDAEKKLLFYFVYSAKRNLFSPCMADYGGKRLSYLQVLSGIFLLRNKLFGRFSYPRMSNEYVGVLLPNSVAGAMVNGAIMADGKVPVNLNYTLSQELLRYCVDFAGIKRIITSRKFVKKLNLPVWKEMIFLEDVKVNKWEKLLWAGLVLVLPARYLVRRFMRGDLTNVDDVATIMFSSGSTGTPKGVCLSHRNISSNVQAIYEVFDVRKGDKVAGILPFFHSLGFTATLCFPMAVGISVVFYPNPLDAKTVVSMIERYKPTILITTPSFLRLYHKRTRKKEFSSLRGVITGAEKLNRSLAEEFSKKWNIPIYEGYGATELSPIAAVSIPGARKDGSVGLPIPGVTIKITDVESEQELGPEQEGLIWVKGPNVMLGYLNNPFATYEVIKDGWYCTGDIGYRDRDGYLYVIDRLVRFSKIGGEMVPHLRIEEEVRRIIESKFPDTNASCVVVGVRDEAKGERLVVLIEGELDLDVLWESLKTAKLPPLWIPRREDIFIVDRIPLLGSGKIDLKKVKTMAQGLVFSRDQEKKE